MVGIKQNKQAIVWRIEGLKDSPPELVMYINPTNLDTSYTQLVNEIRTRGGFVQEFWGEQLTSLSASGRTAMFYDDNGITNQNANISEAYDNFIRLINIYKNNGKEYIQPKTNADKANPYRITGFGIVVMVYMGKEYEGFFESFSIKEMADKPFNLDYDFSFKVTRTLGDFIVQDGTFIRETNTSF